MTKHFLGCLIRNTSTKSIAILPLPYKNASINGLIHENAYAYFSFESDNTSFPPKPSNISSITYLGGQVYTQEEMAKDISSFSQELTLWGSNKVVKLWVDYRTKATQLNGTDSLFEFERILYEIRKDMGFKKLKKGTLLKFVVNDLDESIHNLKKS